MKNFSVTIRTKSGREHSIAWHRAGAIADYERLFAAWRDGTPILTSHAEGDGPDEFAFAVAASEVESIKFEIEESGTA